MRIPVATLAILALAACAQSPATAPPTPPATEGRSLQDPIVLARQNAIAFFRRPPAGQPASAAVAFANIEYLADAVPADPRWSTGSGTAITQLQVARGEMRRALRIAPNAPSQSVVTGLSGAAEAIRGNDRAAIAAALPRDVFTAGPEGTVRLLSQPVQVRSAGGALAALSAGPAQSR